MTLRTDHHHLTSIKVLRACSTEGLPSNTVFHFGRATQLLHREYVMKGTEKAISKSVPKSLIC
jgi:hypothetical protein